MGISMDIRGIQPYQAHQLQHPLFSLAGGLVHAMNPHRLLDNLSHGHTGVEAGIRILEDHLHMLALLSQSLPL